MKLYGPSTLTPEKLMTDQRQALQNDQTAAVLVLSDSQPNADRVAQIVMAGYSKAVSYARDNPDLFSDETLASVTHQANHATTHQAKAGETGDLTQMLRTSRSSGKTPVVTFVNPEADMEGLGFLMSASCAVVDTRLPDWMPVAEI